MSIQEIYKNQVIDKLEHTIKSRSDELKLLKKQLKMIKEGNALPELEKDKIGRFKWLCIECGKVAGSNHFPANIPFAADSVCSECEHKTSHDLMKIAEGL